MNSEYPKKKKILSILKKYIFKKKKKKKNELLCIIKKNKKKSLIDKDTYKMLKGVMKIPNIRIKDIMIPKPEMITLKTNFNLNKCLDVIIQSSHSRLPVTSEDSNYIEGFIIAKDLLPFMRSKRTNVFLLKNIIRPILFTPESKYINYMLKEFRLKKHHIAIVIDEFGNISGLITIEDILEIIVGSIKDEYDDIENKNIQKINKNTFSIKAITQIREFNKIFNTNFHDQKIDTIGGLIIKKFGRLPKKGEYIFINGYKFNITSSNNRRIINIYLKTPQKK
ncbi:transporter associated domain-containing protein [Buchnera aphidicola (Mollitrichosiphum nigrofasciatum)]|uniref:transporter associated domain-containing protein n=1 Tax=Buchnera aphidicola TaxID=9 RepID=UPI0031B87616